MKGLLAICALCLWPSLAMGFVAVGAGGGSGPSANPPLVNCPSFGTGTTHITANCGVFFPNSDSGGAGAFMLTGASNGAVPGMSGNTVIMEPNGAVHNAVGLIYQPVQVPVGKFNATATWVANNWNFAIVLENSTNQPGNVGNQFAGGAGCEGGFFQGFSVATPPDNVFAVQFDQTQYIKEADSGFTYSGVGVFQSNVAGWSNAFVQCPCVPMNQCGTNNTPTALTTQRVSTFPVPLNSPANAQATTTGDTYSAGLTYDGTTLTAVLSDLTVGGSISQSWTVNIPTSVGQSKAYFGVVGSTNAASTGPLIVNSLTYSVPSPL